MCEELAELDVRDDLRQGRDPFAKIIAATGALVPGGRVCLVAPFKPEPMIRLLSGRGFTCSTQERENGDWSVLIERGEAPVEQLPAAPPACPGRPSAAAAPVAVPTSGARELDARGLEPPEPLMRILEAVESLKPGELLLARTDRRPVFLYEQLEERGCVAESEDAPEGGVLTRIQRRED